VFPPPQDLHQSLQARLSAGGEPLAQQGSGAFGEPPDSSGGARSGGGDSGGRSGNDELTEVRPAWFFEASPLSLSLQQTKQCSGHRLRRMNPSSCDRPAKKRPSQHFTCARQGPDFPSFRSTLQAMASVTPLSCCQ